MHARQAPYATPGCNTVSALCDAMINNPDTAGPLTLILSGIRTSMIWSATLKGHQQLDSISFELV